MNEPCKVFRHKTNKKLVIEVYPDFDGDSPRNWDNICKIVCFHRHYNIGDKHDYNQNDYNSWEELKQAIMKLEKVVAIAPIFLYDHGSIHIKVGSFQGMLPQGHAEFDSGQIGFIYVTMKSLEEFGFKKRTKKAIAKAEEWIKIEMETYSQYIEGDVYGFQKKEDGEETDSCWGFYGSDFDENGLFESAGVKFEDFEEVNFTVIHCSHNEIEIED